MFKKLMGGLALVVFGGLIVSCGQDFGDLGSSVGATIEEHYENAFVERFGQPSASQNWGFSDNVASTRAAEADWTQYARSAADYLDGLTEAEMKEYTAFTDADIDAQGHIFGTSSMGASRAMTRAGEKVYDGGEYEIVEGFNPADGESVYMYNGNLAVAKITFYGGGGAAVADKRQKYRARLERPYIIFKSLVEASGSGWQLCVYHDEDYSRIHYLDLTENKEIADVQHYNFSGYSGNITGQHSYKIYADDNKPVAIYAITHYIQGNVVDDDESDDYTGDNTGDNTGGNTGDNTGDNAGGNEQPTNYSKLYRVASGTEITKDFHITTNVKHGSVIYVEGKLNVGTSCTTNGVTIVVANGGEVALTGYMGLSTHGNFIVLPGGKITGNDGSKIAVTNGSKCYNAGEINYAGELNVNGSEFYNCGTVNVSKLRNTSGGKITNFGKIIAGGNEDAADTYNCTFINGCYWHYTGNAGIGTLTMLNNSRLDVDGKALFSGQQRLYDLSTINCRDIQCQQASFAGPTGTEEFAIVKISRDVYIGCGGDITASGNVYFDWAKKNEGLYVNSQWSDLDNEWSAYHGIKANMSKFASDVDKTLYIPEGECTGAGYTNNGGSSRNTSDTGNTDSGDVIVPEEQQSSSVIAGTTPTSAICRIIVEDLTVGQTADFDFNDVVFDVCPNDDGATTTLIIRAVGGELQLWIEGQEVHQAVWGTINTKMMNTGRDGAIDYTKECGRIVIDKYIGSRSAAKNITVEVTRMGKNIPLTSDVGKAASKVCVGTDYQWCSEGQDIDRKFHNNGTKLFQQYVIGKFGDDWYNQ